MLEHLYRKWIHGDHLTDEEIIKLRDTFKAARDSTYNLGSYFRLAFLEANSQYIQLDKICKARNL